MSVAAAISALGREGEPRTWSLIVTLFGDLARAPGAELPGPVLSAITGRIGVRPEAMRVALHRLRKDGWIASRRAGRVSYYRLSPSGRAEAEAASPRIYASAAPVIDRWHVLVAAPNGDAQEIGATAHVALAPGVWLGLGEGTDREGVFRLAGSTPTVPDWLRAALMPAELAQAYAEFDAQLTRAEAALAPGEPSSLPDLDRAALRVLMVHGWRRLVLRHPALPDGFFPDDWAGPRARTRVSQLLKRIGRPEIHALSHLATQPTGAV